MEEEPNLWGVASLEDVAVELGVHPAGVVGDEGELGIGRSGRGQGDPAQGVGHEEGLQTGPRSQQTLSTILPRRQGSKPAHRFILGVYFDPFDGEPDGDGPPPPPARLLQGELFINHQP